MKRFKKRTIALVLASVVTVVGAFGAGNYRNSLMSLKLESSNSGAVNMTLLTKRDYTNTITPVKKDASTYVIMLPETNSEMPSAPELAGDVESVDVKTMPYTTNSRGYTKITVKTLPNTDINVQKALYIPGKEDQRALPAPENVVNEELMPPVEQRIRSNDSQSVQEGTPQNMPLRAEPIRSSSGVNQTQPEDINRTIKQFEQTPDANNQNEMQENVSPEQPTQTSQDEELPVSEIILIILGIILAIAVSAFIVLKARDKMAEITGEQNNLDFSSNDDVKPQKESKRKKIKNTIKTLDKMYTKPVKMPVNQSVEIPQNPAANQTEPAQEESVVVDLDELFQEQSRQEDVEIVPEKTVEEENSALEDFLNSYSFMDEEENNTDENNIQEVLYNKYISDENLIFSQNDIDKINKLLDSEISDEAMKYLENSVVSNPINKQPSKTEILENLITSYTIKQNISFSKDDVDALKKLIDVELDRDFIEDLRCNPERTAEMQREIESHNVKSHKTSDLITLNVKDMLPDLSEALKKQGGKRIESEVKPEVVYFSEGYDVSTLKLNDALPDLSKELDNEEAYKSQPSEAIQYVDTRYEVAKMNISNELPDLEDALLNPEKYETKEEVVEVDEEALLRNLTNVTFKPFQDGYKAPSVTDIQEEFNRLDNNFEIIKQDDEDIPKIESEKDDFEDLYDNNYFDLDKNRELLAKEESFENTEYETLDIPDSAEAKASTKKEENFLPQDFTLPEPLLKEAPEPIQESFSKGHENLESERITNRRKEIQQNRKRLENSDDKKEAQKLLDLIEAKHAERKAKQKIELRNTRLNDHAPDKTSNAAQVKKTCSVEGEMYSIVATSKFTENMGCYLAKNEKGYSIIGFTGDKIFKIKYYETLKNEKLESRISEHLDNGTKRYLVRIGLHKFILNVSGENMEYVMDLC